MKQKVMEKSNSHHMLSENEWAAQYKDVPQNVRDLWNVELDLLDQFEAVCNKHGLRWFADGGTLLGAVRHHGYIPWDDDIDIIMPLKDYQILSKLGSEFEDPYFLQSWETEDGFDPFKMKLRRSDTTGYTWREGLCTKNWNRGIAIDIFALVNIPDNKLMEAAQITLLKMIRVLFRGYEAGRDHRQTANSRVVSQVIKLLYMVVSPFLDYKTLSKMYIKIACWNKKPSKRCGPIIFVPGQKQFVWSSSWYSKVTYLQFMNRKVPCPCKWDDRLRAQYQDYMIPVRGTTKHGEVYFDPYVPYDKGFPVKE